LRVKSDGGFLTEKGCACGCRLLALEKVPGKSWHEVNGRRWAGLATLTRAASRNPEAFLRSPRFVGPRLSPPPAHVPRAGLNQCLFAFSIFYAVIISYLGLSMSFLASLIMSV
jgi:hypothetical protein